MPLNGETVTHPVLGNIVITYNARARHIIMRVRNSEICVTAPPHASLNDIYKALNEHQDKLAAQRRRSKAPLIDVGYSIETPFFVFTLQKTNQQQFTLKREKEGIYTLLCPHSATLCEEPRQVWLRKVIKNAMRHRASEMLPTRLKELAAQKGFAHGKISVRDTHTRWGSCNSRKDISLSIHLVLLPLPLIDYVIMHELCHTVEMNHSPRFWKLLDKALETDSKDLRKQLREFSTYF
ncbi:MAG: M48 family metallopeptidase [Bacteroidaceae bacterium]|nr:M48 family metallopeptidase [Bacteroidaceae bacterium]MBQ3623252.1 M48 family metallopeptidase [Bacteroidaceae bacterium]